MKKTYPNSLENDDARKPWRSIFERTVNRFHLNDSHDLLLLSIIKYVPPSVIACIVGVIVLVTIGFGVLSQAFLTNVPLNGLSSLKWR